MADTEEEIKDEGARSFAVFTANLGGGNLNKDASAELQKVLEKLRDEADYFNIKVKGSLKLELKFSLDPLGVLQVDHDVSSKLPKRKRPTATAWLTKGGNATFEHPKQMKLGIRGVARGDDYDDKTKDSTIDGPRRGGAREI